MIVKYGIIGCGTHAIKAHVWPTKEIDDLELVAVFDIAKQNMDQIELEYGKPLRKYQKEYELLNDPDLDAILIASPDIYHTSTLLRVLNAGKHAFVEKPIASTDRDLEILSRCLLLKQKKKKIVMTCLPQRFDAPHVWLKENEKALEYMLGRVQSVYIDFSYKKSSKVWKKQTSLLLDHISHEIDLLHFLFGYASPYDCITLVNQPDRYHVVGKRPDGISFNFEGTRKLENIELDEEALYREIVRIRFESGEIKVNVKTGKATILDHNTDRRYTVETGERNYLLRSKKVMENFCRAIQGKGNSYLTDRDLVEGAFMSVKLSKPTNK